MNPQRYERLREIFFEACDLELRERQAYLKGACADDPTLLYELGALFQADTGTAGLLEDAAITDDMRTRFKEALDAIQPVTWPDTIGKYTILRKISDGGMGTVFEAEQQNPHRKIALKIIRAGAVSEETLKRFELEADVLALLQHSGIAQIFEAGTADTGMGIQPYLAMELVYGEPITEYVKSNNLNLEARLKLIASVCEAVHHAHQKGVVHRDLKPANILVDETGQPKILDFGVARITNQDIKTATIRTEIGQLIGTLAYMSPEQAAGDPKQIDIRSDVYSLGVIAFEILSGNMPYNVGRKMVHEAVRVIQEEEPTRLSSVDRDLRGDVDTIVAKALAKDKERRYQSASDLSSDIHRFLNDEPITARPPSAMYQFNKFTHRNKVLVGGIAATFMMLILGIAGTSYGLIQAKANEREANAREQDAIESQSEAEKASAIAQSKTAELIDARDESEAITQFLIKLLRSSDPRKLGRDVLVRDLLQIATRELDDSFSTKPLVEARLREAIGFTYINLGDLEEADKLLPKALEIRIDILGPDHPATLTSMNSLASQYSYLGKFAKAEPLFKKVLEGRRKVLGLEHPDTLGAISNLANLFASQEKLDEALPLFIEAVDLEAKTLGIDHIRTMNSKLGLATLYSQMGQLEKAEVIYLEIANRMSDQYPDGHTLLAGVFHNLSILYMDQNRIAESKESMQKAIEILEKHVGSDHYNSVSARFNLANVYFKNGEYEEAKEIWSETLGEFIRIFGIESIHTVNNMKALGEVFYQLSLIEEAEKQLIKAIEIARELLPDSKIDLGELLSLHGKILVELGTYKTAENTLLEAINILTECLGENHNDVLDQVQNMAALYEKWSKPDKAKEYLTILEKAGRQTSWDNDE